MNQNFLCRLGNRLWFRLSYFELGLRLPLLLLLHMASEDYYSHRAGVSDNEGWGSGIGLAKIPVRPYWMALENVKNRNLDF